ncbi:MAG: HAD-IA family hydrolase [Pirellulales bacterium]
MFDAVGTLIRPQPTVAAAYLTAAHRHGIAADWTENEVDRRFRAALSRQEELDRAAGWATSEHRERHRWQAIVRDVFGAASHHAELFTDLWDHFADPQNWSPIEAARQQLVTARQAGLTIGVASNFDARLHQLLAAMPELDVADNVFVSSEIGWRKPSREFFRTVEAKLGLAAEQILLVGDDVKNDYSAAQDAGWKALLVDRSMRTAAQYE